MQGWRKRQEDTHIIAISQGDKKNIDIFGVFDGRWGKEISQFISNHFTEELIKNKNFPKSIEIALKETFIFMDELMQTSESIEEIGNYARMSREEDNKQAKDEPQKSQYLITDLVLPEYNVYNDILMNKGCTACVMIIDETNKKLYFANAGDSRVVICCKENAEAMSEEHKPELDSEKTRIYKADGWIMNGRVKGNLNLSRGFGDLEYKQNKNLTPEEQMVTANPDIKSIDYKDDIDFVIIGSNGIWECLTNQEACDFVRKRLKDNHDIQISKKIEEMLDSIVAEDLYNGKGVGCDNMTCVVIVFKKENK